MTMERPQRRSCAGALLVASAIAGGVAAAQPAAPDFWKHWGDGQAEMNGYRLTQPRYGARRTGTAVLIFVTEDLSDSLRVKADPGKHPAADVYPVMKLNEVRDFQTGIYDYNVMTSVFARVARGWPIAKVSFSSQEWCGHVYHQILPRAGRVPGILHSYFDGEADGSDDLDWPENAVFADALPILLRGWNGDYLQPGEERDVPYLPSLLTARLDHQRLAWGRAKLSRAAHAGRVRVPAGEFEVKAYTVTPEGSPSRKYEIEAAAPFRLVRWSSQNGEEGVLLGSKRLAYWKLNGPGGEKHLKGLGLGIPASR